LVNERREYFPAEDILAEVEQALAAHAPGEIDWVTFVGSGETTLHAGLGRLIRQVKSLTRLPVAVITNGSLLYRPEVRLELSLADAVLPSLDAGNAGLYFQINRPHPQASYQRLVEGLATFRREYQGKLWVEVMLVRGLNDTKTALGEIGAAMKAICPDQIHILQPNRPPAEPWVLPPDEDGLLRADAILGDVARVIRPACGSFDLGGSGSMVEAVIAIITRHPMREDELTAALQAFPPEELTATLKALERSGKAQMVERFGARFWSASGARYPSTRRRPKAGRQQGSP
jgi:wyosine [tRNA(Phe)-imidazoG37] synthetase (radical SAM superfamily)